MGAQSSTSVTSLSSTSVTLLYMVCWQQQSTNTTKSYRMSQNCDKLQVQQETNCNSSKASQYRQQGASKLVQLTLPSEIYKKTHTNTTSSLGGFSLMPLISIKHCMQIGDSRPIFALPTKLFGIYTTHRFCTKKQWKFGAKLPYNGLFASFKNRFTPNFNYVDLQFADRVQSDNVFT